MATVRAPQRLDPSQAPPGTRRAPRAEARPDLRVVAPLGRFRVAPPVLAAAGAVALFTLLFGLAAFHAVLVQGQQRLDSVDRRVDEEQARYQRLRLEVARLESPGRIVDEAVTGLGMVPPAGTTYLTPSAALEAEVAADAGAGDATEPPGGAEEAANGGSEPGWTDVKPYLDPTP